MRTLCLHLPPLEQPCLAEAFLSLSPRVQFRPPHFVFIDMESTAGLLGGEDRALDRALQIAGKLGSSTATAAIADQPAVAQVLALNAKGLSPAGEDARALAELPLATLTDLEGLLPWPQSRQIEHIIQFFHSLGMNQLKELWSLSLVSFRERWGETGVTLWKRLHGLESQVISPLIPNDPFQAYAYFDDPVGLLPLLRHRLDELLQVLFLRLEGQGRFAQKIELRLFCEYSKHRHHVVIEPVSPSRNLELFQDLLYAKLEGMDMENPIRECEIELYDVGEKIEQLDFFEPRDSSQDRWQRLISFAEQADVEVGFLELIPQHFPENSYHLKADWPKLLRAEDHIEKQEQAIQVKSIYAKGLLTSPRPTLLLEKPQPLHSNDLKRYRRLSFFPTERIEASWWARLREALRKKGESAKDGPSTSSAATAGSSRPASDAPLQDRDYYFAVSNSGELVWIYQDRQSKSYFLHGYFD